LLVDDEATTLPGQLRKTEFLRTLRPMVCAAADRELARAGRNTDGCPYLDRWFAYYQGREAQQVERSLRRYAPETASARSASDYLAPISARIAQGVHRWVDTGEVPELPDGMSPDMLGDGGGVLGALASVGSAIASVGSAIGSFFSNLFFKANAGGAARGADRGALDARLGAGRPLDGGARSRMASAFGHDFSAVRIHTDASAAALAEGLNARAFTLGTHIAFGAGQYRPGQPVGDVLLAHELAHVVQQSGAGPVTEAPPHDEPVPSLEADADAAAEAAVIALWGDRHGIPGQRKQARPRSSTAWRLQRCGGAAPRAEVPGATSEVPDLPDDVVARIRPAIASQDASVRQAALDALVAWGRTSSSIGVDWNRIASVSYDTAVGAQGSRTELANLMQIRMYIGPVAFVSPADLYATFRHELVHVVQANAANYAATQRRGTGWREVDAYLWQLEHAGELGLLARNRWGVQNGQADVNVGLARVVDGLFRYDDLMGQQRHDNPSIIPDDEWRALGRRMGRALLNIPWEVVQAVRPELPRQIVEDLAAGRAR
jgi:hypothetical protein